MEATKIPDVEFKTMVIRKLKDLSVEEWLISELKGIVSIKKT